MPGCRAGDSDMTDRVAELAGRVRAYGILTKATPPNNIRSIIRMRRSGRASCVKLSSVKCMRKTS